MLTWFSTVQQATEIVGENVWFSENFANYVYNINTLPYGHHLLAGLVAPRAFYSTSNTACEWLSLLSAFGCMTAAQKIWQALKVPGANTFNQDGDTFIVRPVWSRAVVDCILLQVPARPAGKQELWNRLELCIQRNSMELPKLDRLDHTYFGVGQPWITRACKSLVMRRNQGKTGWRAVYCYINASHRHLAVEMTSPNAFFHTKDDCSDFLSYIFLSTSRLWKYFKAELKLTFVLNKHHTQQHLSS